MKFFKKKWFKIVGIIIAIPVVIIGLLIGYLFWKQEAIVQDLLQTYNATIEGEITIEKSQISLFQNFPNVAIDLKNAKLFADKSKSETQEIVHLNDLYVGFNLVDIINGNYTVKSITLDKGHIDLVQYEDGSYNVTNVLSLDESSDTTSEIIQFRLDKIDLDFVDVQLTKPHLQQKIALEFEHIHSAFNMRKELMKIQLDTKFLGTIYKNDQPTLLNKKLFALDTELKYYLDKPRIVIDSTQFSFEHIFLNLVGSVELEGEKNIDLTIDGSQENFNLLIAFAPEELIPTLKLYDNKGKIFLSGDVKGSMKDGQMPAINAQFKCEDGYFKNQKNQKTLDNIEFSGSFTNGEKRDLSTMKFAMNKMKAQPEAGIFDAQLEVVNFNEPDIDLKLKSNFNLDFLVKFINMEDEIRNPSGFVGVTMNFHDIIDLAHPERSLEKLNESYFTELVVKNLSFESNSYPLPIKNVNIHADIEGNKLNLSEFNGMIGKSDINVVGSISDVPAILHQRSTNVVTKLTVAANHIDISELTFDAKSKTSALDEKVDNFKLDLAFLCEASALTSFKKIPVGEFKLNSLNAKLHNYPHVINEVTAGLFIEEQDIKIKRFKGKIDESDFVFFGNMKNYQHFVKPTSKAKSEISVFFKSKLINLDNLLTYKSENMLPENIKNESFSDVKVKVKLAARFDGDQLKGTVLELSDLDLTTSLHEKRFNDFSCKMYLWKNNLAIKNLKGTIGTSDFDLSLNLFLGKNDSLRKRDNELKFVAKHFDLNEIMAIKYNPIKGENVVEATEEKSDKPFSIEDIPFFDFNVEADIQHFEYLDHKLDNIKANVKMTKNKVITFKRCGFDLAGGKIRMGGKFDASNPNKILFSPRFFVKDLLLDQALMKFKNFGQEVILSDNLSGALTAKIKGLIPLNSDLTPKMDETELTLDIQILDGELKNYKALEDFASFFGDKNLNRIKFDTLANIFTLKNNQFSIPWMTINSSLGFLEVAGEQSLAGKMDMEYYVKVPLKLVSSVGYQKLFKRKQEEIDPEQEDEIQYRGDKKVHYINIKMMGDAEDFSISLGKDKRAKKST